MSSDDYDYYSDDDEEEGGAEDGGEGAAAGQAASSDLRNWLDARRGWLLIAGITVAQVLFWAITMMLRTEGRPVEEMSPEEVQALAVDMLGHEVGIGQIYQLVPVRGGRRMTIGLDLVLVLGQLPAERIAGAERPTAKEMELFIAAVRDMEPRVRSRVNSLLQRIPKAELDSAEAYATIKDDVREYVNDGLDRLDFGGALRPGIDKRRVTEVLLPMFVRQYM